MAVGSYRGVSNVARKVKKRYRGVDGVAREVKKRYRGVGNVARQVFNSESDYEVAARYSSGNDTQIVAFNLNGGIGYVDLSLETQSYSGTGTVNGALGGMRLTRRDGELMEGQILSFDIAVTNGLEYRSYPILYFLDSNNSSISYKQFYADENYSAVIPDGTHAITLSIWARYNRSCAANITNFKIGEEVVDLTISFSI